MSSLSTVLKKTSFGSSPSKGMEVVDSYKQGQLDTFLKDPSGSSGAKVAQELYPDVKADKIMGLLNDPATQSYLESSGLTLSGAMDSISRNLPEGVGLNGLLDDFSLPFLGEWTGKLKSSLDFNMFSGLSLGDYSGFLSNFQDYQSRFGWDLDGSDIKNLWGKASGVLPRDTLSMDGILSLANKYSIAEKLVQSGLGREVIDWIKADTTISEKHKQELFKDLLPVFAEAGLHDLITEVITLAGGSGAIPPKIRKKTIKGFLYGYRLPVKSSPKDYLAEATALIGRCDSLDSKWDIEDRDGSATYSMRYLHFASEHSLTVLSAHPRTEASALCYREFAAVPTTETSLAQRFIYGNAFLQLQ